MKERYLLIVIFMFVLHFTFGQSSFMFNGEEIRPGTKQHFTIPIVHGKDTTLIPITVFNGTQDGPVLGITAGIHGYEYPPILAAQELLETIDPNQLRGTIMLVQIANVEGFLGRAPYINPLDGKNLNRVYPGNEAGTITEKIAAFITQNIIAKSDFFLDMHGGDAPEDLMPYAAYYSNKAMPTVTKKGRAMAVSLGFDHLVVFDTNGKSYMKEQEPSLYCSAEAFKRGIPSIDIECGRLGQAEPLLVDQITKSVIRLLYYQQMLSSESKDAENTHPIIIKERFYVDAKHQGIFYTKKSSGDYVSRGQQIGYITDYFGQIVETVYASESGIVLMLIATPAINKGETAVVIGKVTDQALNK